MTVMGGTPFDALTFHAAAVRADLCELLRQYSLEHAHKIADALLAEYSITKKKKDAAA